MTRKVIGILTGLALALILASVAAVVSDYVFAPAALDPSDPVQAGQIMARMPLPGLLLAMFSQFVSAVFGGFVGARIAKGRWAAWSSTGLLAAVTLLGQVMAHYPLWLVITTIALIAAAGWLAGHWAGDPDPDEEELLAAPIVAAAPWSAEPEPEDEPFEPAAAEPELEPTDDEADHEPEITRPRWASFDELRAAAPAPSTRDDERD